MRRVRKGRSPESTDRERLPEGKGAIAPALHRIRREGAGNIALRRKLFWRETRRPDGEGAKLSGRQGQPLKCRREDLTVTFYIYYDMRGVIRLASMAIVASAGQFVVHSALSFSTF
jgi:hypothetical protein